MYIGGDIVRDGLVLHLDAGSERSYPKSGTVWRDLSGNRNDGVLTNGPTFDSGNGGSILLDGINDFILTSTLNYQLLTSGFTLSMILYYTATTSNDNIISWGNSAFNSGNSNAWELRIRNLGSYIEFAPGRVIGEEATPRRLSYFPNKSFNLRLFSIDVTYVANGICNIYENGILVSTLNYNGVQTSNTTNSIRIGRGTDTYCNAKFYNLKLYNRALTADEVEKNYNATKKRFGL